MPQTCSKLGLQSNLWKALEKEKEKGVAAAAQSLTPQPDRPLHGWADEVLTPYAPHACAHILPAVICRAV